MTINELSKKVAAELHLTEKDAMGACCRLFKGGRIKTKGGKDYLTFSRIYDEPIIELFGEPIEDEVAK